MVRNKNEVPPDGGQGLYGAVDQGCGITFIEDALGEGSQIGISETFLMVHAQDEVGDFVLLITLTIPLTALVSYRMIGVRR